MRSDARKREPSRSLMSTADQRLLFQTLAWAGAGELKPWLDAVETILARRMANAWDQAAHEAHACGWTHDYGRDDLIGRNPFRGA